MRTVKILTALRLKGFWIKLGQQLSVNVWKLRVRVSSVNCNVHRYLMTVQAEEKKIYWNIDIIDM